MKRKHGISISDYVERFPGALTICPKVSQKKTDNNLKMWETRDSKLAAKLMVEGRTNESYAKMSATKKQQAKHRTPEQVEECRSKMSEMAKKFHTDCAYADIRKERSQKISETHLRNMEDQDKSKGYLDRMSAARSVAHKNLREMSAEELDAFLSRSFLKIPKIYKFEHKGQHYGVRSSYEEIVLKKLVDLKIKFHYEPTSFPRSDGKMYRPDFIVNNTVIEVKSTYWLNRMGHADNAKRQQACESKGFNYQLILEDVVFNDDKLTSTLQSLESLPTSGGITL